MFLRVSPTINTIKCELIGMVICYISIKFSFLYCYEGQFVAFFSASKIVDVRQILTMYFLNTFR